jgi:hypothetical protein
LLIVVTAVAGIACCRSPAGRLDVLSRTPPRSAVRATLSLIVDCVSHPHHALTCVVASWSGAFRYSR